MYTYMFVCMSLYTCECLCVCMCVCVSVCVFVLGVFEPVKYQLKGCTDLFVDGGMLCNFPIYVFDGESTNRSFLILFLWLSLLIQR